MVILGEEIMREIEQEKGEPKPFFIVVGLILR